jgi:hypothetical protein
LPFTSFLKDVAFSPSFPVDDYSPDNECYIRFKYETTTLFIDVNTYSTATWIYVIFLVSYTGPETVSDIGIELSTRNFVTYRKKIKKYNGFYAVAFAGVLKRPTNQSDTMTTGTIQLTLRDSTATINSTTGYIFTQDTIYTITSTSPSVYFPLLLDTPVHSSPEFKRYQHSENISSIFNEMKL